MKKLFIYSYLHTVYAFCMAQSSDFKELVKLYDTELKLPIELVHSLPVQDTVSRSLLNRVLFDHQSERAKFYSIEDSLYRVTTYGRISEKPFDYETWKKEDGEVKWYREIFTPKAYAVGYIPISEVYHALITKVVGTEVTYYDLYLFDKQGILRSLVNLYEAEYERIGQPENISEVYMQSSITKDGVIKRHEERFNVTTDREYQLQSDGYFKVIHENIEGEFEY